MLEEGHRRTISGRAGSNSAGRCGANSLHQYPAAWSDWWSRSKWVACFAQWRAKSISPVSRALAVSSSHAAAFRSRAWARIMASMSRSRTRTGVFLDDNKSDMLLAQRPDPTSHGG